MAGEKYQYVLPKRMKALMERRGMTVSKLAARTGVSSKTIYGWLAGNPPRHLEDLFAVVRALNSTIEELAFVKASPEVPNFSQRVLFGQWLKLCRERVRMSEREASDNLGLAAGLLKSYEEGEDIPMGVLLSLMELYLVDKTVFSAKLSALT